MDEIWKHNFWERCEKNYCCVYCHEGSIIVCLHLCNFMSIYCFMQVFMNMEGYCSVAEAHHPHHSSISFLHQSHKEPAAYWTSLQLCFHYNAFWQCNENLFLRYGNVNASSTVLYRHTPITHKQLHMHTQSPWKIDWFGTCSYSEAWYDISRKCKFTFSFSYSLSHTHTPKM